MSGVTAPFPLVLVTGASGWLGGRVVSALTGGLPEAGALGGGGSRVRCLVGPEERTEGLRTLGAELSFGDIRDPDARRALLHKAEGAARRTRRYNASGTLVEMVYYVLDGQGDYVLSRRERKGKQAQ